MEQSTTSVDYNTNGVRDAETRYSRFESGVSKELDDGRWRAEIGNEVRLRQALEIGHIG